MQSSCNWQESNFKQKSWWVKETADFQSHMYLSLVLQLPFNSIGPALCYMLAPYQFNCRWLTVWEKIQNMHLSVCISEFSAVSTDFTGGAREWSTWDTEEVFGWFLDCHANFTWQPLRGSDSVEGDVSRGKFTFADHYSHYLMLLPKPHLHSPILLFLSETELMWEVR